MDKQRHVFHQYLRGLILAGMVLFLFRLAVNDSLKYYLSPRMHLYLYAAMILLSLFSMIQLSVPENDDEQCSACTHRHALPKKGLPTLLFYGLFLFPIVSGFTFPDHTLGSDIAAGRQIRQTASSQSLNTADTAHDQSGKQTDSQTNNSSGGQAISQNQFDQLKARLLRQKKIVVDNKNYTNIMTIIEQNIDSFKGRPIEITGFVYRDKNMSNNEIVTARFVITCCIADASVYGLLTRGHVTNLKKDTWIKVSGTLGNAVRQNRKLPVLNVKQVSAIPQPEHPYVYDYGIRLD